ncbi:acetyl-CoA carboxylase ACC1 [Toxoplasma gondii TgCatPRC2]|uniref:Acetyl-CoA carboxylase ACC1 n=1 Tax=Toxoplasma gondii TgCatPRC2 TaxID=1130821 RepID=A0A151HIA5_TOXGO|nr:acetyl-CoA carboxylase ACC1 [Toxoplasma gondii TgCatPRC2]
MPTRTHARVRSVCTMGVVSRAAAASWPLASRARDSGALWGGLGNDGEAGNRFPVTFSLSGETNGKPQTHHCSRPIDHRETRRGNGGVSGFFVFLFLFFFSPLSATAGPTQSGNLLPYTGGPWESSRRPEDGHRAFSLASSQPSFFGPPAASSGPSHVGNPRGSDLVPPSSLSPSSSVVSSFAVSSPVSAHGLRKRRPMLPFSRSRRSMTFLSGPPISASPSSVSSSARFPSRSCSSLSLHREARDSPRCHGVSCSVFESPELRHSTFLSHPVPHSPLSSPATPASFSSRSAPGNQSAIQASTTESRVGEREGEATPTRVGDGEGDPLADYVRKHGGKRVIRRVLIANNGMAATKSIFSMRQWAYMELGDDKLLEFVVMATPEDMRANPEFIRRADKIVEVPGGPNRNNYANVDLICQIAVQEKVDAVWPGWGHASENPNLPRRLSELGITFIGPSATVMAALGDKIAANILAQTAGVPSIPWSGDSLKATLDSTGAIPRDIFDQATVKSVEECEKVADRIGYPMMIKASEGGGGKGIRMVDRKEQVRGAYEQVVAEVPGSPVFMMQLCTAARHIEVQIVGDEDGQAVALSGRDCSTQRRFQKIFEEAPPTTVVPPHTMKEMEKAAQRLTQSLGYVGAGTVEYLYNRKDDKFFFLELNPRLQVEHPVSEGVTGVNLPAAQLQVAMGIPLWRIPDIRRFFGRDPNAGDRIDFINEDYLPIQRHVLASRVTAENPDEGFKPTSGRVDRLEFQPLENVWGYFSVGASGGVHEYADSQFGHIFATGKNREEARKKLVLGLKRVDVRGEIRTPIEYLVQLLEDKDFIENRIDTSWLDKLIKQRKRLGEKKVEKAHVVLAAVLFRAIRALKEKEQRVLSALQRGQRYIHDLASLNTVSQEVVYEDQRFSFEVSRTGPQLYVLKLNTQEVECVVREQPDGSYIVLFPGEKSHKFNGREEPLGLRLQVDGTTVLLPNVFDPSELRSDVTGKVVRYLVPDKGQVKKGEPYVEVEAMKMIMTLTAGETGVLSHTKSPGSVVNTGDVLGTLALEDPSRVKKIVDFSGLLDLPRVKKREAADAREKQTEGAGATFSLFGSPEDEAAMRLRLAMEGYEQDVESTVQKLAFPSVDTRNLQTKKEKLTELLVELFQSFLSVDEPFASVQGGEVAVDGPAAEKKVQDPATLLKLKLAHSRLQPRIQLVLSLLRALQNFPNFFPEWTMPVSLELCLTRLAALHGRAYGQIALEAIRLLRSFRVAPFEQRVQRLKAELLQLPSASSSKAGSASERETNVRRAERIARSGTASAGIDLLSHLFGDGSVSLKALEVAVRRHYRGFPIDALHTELFEVETQDGSKKEIPVAFWSFRQGDLTGAEAPLRTGVMGAFQSLEEVQEVGDRLLARLRQFDEEKRKDEGLGESHREREDTQEPRNVCLFALTTPMDFGTEEEKLKSRMQGIIHSLQPSLRSADVRLAAVHVPQVNKSCRMFNFLASDGFDESRIRRDLCPTVPSLIELNRLQTSFDLTRLDALDPNTQAYLALPRLEPSAKGEVSPSSPSTGPGAASAQGASSTSKKPVSQAQAPQNVFVRRLIFENEVKSDFSDLPRILLDLLDVLDRCASDPRVSATASGRLFLHIVSPLNLASAKAVTEHFHKMMKRFRSEHNERLLRLRVDQIEVKMHLRKGGSGSDGEKRSSREEGAEATGSQAKEKERLQVLRLSVSSHQGSWLHTKASEDVPHVLTGDPIAQRSFVFDEGEETDAEGFVAQASPAGSGAEGADGAKSRATEKTGQREGDAAPVVSREPPEAEGLLGRISVGLKTLRGTQTSATGSAGAGEMPAASSSLPGRWEGGDRKKQELLSVSRREENEFFRHEKDADPYPEVDRIAMARSAARRAGSTYIFDFLGLMEIALLQSWQTHLKEKGEKDGGVGGWDEAVPRDLFKAEAFKVSAQGTLYLDPDWRVADNKIGMVGFLITLKTPEYPSGRQVVLLGNDITFQGGSFGVPEHLFFTQVSRFSREQGLPRVYIACNSGARIGLYENLKDKIKVEWNDASNPSLGFKNLYLSAEDYAALPPGVVSGHFEEAVNGDQRRFVLDAIIGDPDKFIGVENLRGSGTIAGETSRAYDETFTLSYVTGRSVGIGAYIVRLAQRTIQMVRGPLLLTGYQALNKLLGREVYASQDQLGGPEVMFRNGVSHLVVQNDQEGMKEVLRWLAYTPKTARDSVSSAEMFSSDPVEREVAFTPTKAPYDVRHMLAGYTKEDGTFVSGFFDKNSFKEYLAGWGKSVVVGRARLGGIPFGAIAVETRTTEARVPADPSSPDSRESVIMHAGQVWFPDSAYKTAQAINDFNRGENLPLIIFANWRGFSGGTRDMFEEILKFGSQIVDALRTYKQPVFIYIPPHGELRGGSWVVVDPTINLQKMEMYADANARGGVLEPPGICEIKYRAADQKALMHRVDDVLKELDKQLQDCQTASDAIDLKEKIKRREAALEPLYLSIARFYADLHDRPERMKARGVISSIVNWKNSRTFFYWRAKRRLLQDDLEARILAADARLDYTKARAKIEDLLKSHGVDIAGDKAACEFLSSTEGKEATQAIVERSRREGAIEKIRDILSSLPESERRETLESVATPAC